MSDHKEKLYIGFTGITKTREAEKLASFITNLPLKPESHQFMSGILVTPGTPPTRWADRYAKPEDISDLASILKESTMPMIHYRPGQKNSLSEQLLDVFNKDNLYADNLCRAVQLNKAWPPENQLLELKTQMPDLKIAICLTPQLLSLDNLVNTPQNLKRYQGLMDFIVIDSSGGAGRDLDPNTSSAFYRVIGHNFPLIPITIAGGFDNQNVVNVLNRLESVIGAKDFGIDAEGKLRDKVHAGSITALSIERTKAYLEKTAQFFRS